MDCIVHEITKSQRRLSDFHILIVEGYVLLHHYLHITDEQPVLANKQQSSAVIQTQAAWLPHPHAPALLLKIQALGEEVGRFHRTQVQEEKLSHRT